MFEKMIEIFDKRMKNEVSYVWHEWNSALNCKASRLSILTSAFELGRKFQAGNPTAPLGTEIFTDSSEFEFKI